MDESQRGAAIEAVGLTKAFDGRPAVRGVDIRVEAGESTAIIGPNGAGKTTTLLMLLGAIEPDEGTVDIVGFRLPAERHRAMRHIGFAAGYLPLPEGLRVVEALEFFARLDEVAQPRRAALRALDDLDIGHLQRQQCSSLSSGQQTLVGIAKAIVHRPSLVILDEPTASLDPDVSLRVRDRLATLNREHAVTVLLTSHDMREVEQLTRRVIFLRSGRIVADDAPERMVAAAGFADLNAMFLAEAERHRGEVIE